MTLALACGLLSLEAFLKLNPQHLVTLAWVARTGSISGASEAMGKTQPALSGQIKALNQAVGAPVMIRKQYGVALTQAGLELLPYAEACMRALEGAQDQVRRLRGLEAGRLQVLASTSVAIYLMPEVFARFHRDHPRIELSVSHQSAGVAIRSLEQGRGDLAIVRGALTRETKELAESFVALQILQDEIILAVSREHPLARADSISPAQLEGLPIVSREATSATQLLAEAVAKAAGVKFKVVFQTSGVEALKEAILQGFGAGFLSRIAVQRELSNGMLHALSVDSPEFKQDIHVIYPPKGQSSLIVPKFVDTLRSTLLSRKD